jgi:hypothetical protein
VVLERLDRWSGFSKKRAPPLSSRSSYSIPDSSRLSSLADNKLTTDAWQKIRAYAKEKTDYFARQALAEFQ